MSTKTTFKRVALVAVASLGIGVLTSVSANAVSTTGCTATNLGAGTTGTVTAVTASFGTVTRTAPRTFTTPVTIAVTGTSIGATDTVVVTGTHTLASGVTGTLSLGGAAACTATRNSATSATVTGTLTITSATDAALANVAAMAGAYTATLSANIDATSVAAAAVVVTAPAVTSGTLIAPTAGSGSTSSALLQQVNGQATVKFVAGTSDTSYTVTTSGVGTIVSATPTTTAVVNLSGTNAASGVSWTPVTTAQELDVITTSAVTGTQTITIQPIGTNGIPGTAITATITWGATPGLSSQYSLVKLLDGAVSTDVTSSTLDTTSTSVSKSAGTQRFTIEVEVLDSNNTAVSGTTLGASVSGPGLIGIANSRSATTATGRSLSQALTNEYGSVSVWGDGSAGVATITITATTAAGVTTTLGTKSVTFLGSPSKVTVTQNLKVAKAGTQLGATPTTTIGANTSVATSEAFTAKVMDSAGNAVVSGSTVKMTSSDTTVITVGACAEFTVDGDSSTTTTPTPGVFGCSVSGAAAAISGKSATVTFSVLNAATGLYDIVATPITFKIGGAIASVVVALDKASYAPGAAMNLTATAKDSAGNAAYDGQAAIGSIAANMTVGGALPTAANTEIVDGSFSTTGTSASLFAPASTGSLVISGKTVATATDVAGKAYSVTATVASADNAALTTLVNSLIKKINALSTLVAKIQKKLGVK